MRQTPGGFPEDVAPWVGSTSTDLPAHVRGTGVGETSGGAEKTRQRARNNELTGCLVFKARSEAASGLSNISSDRI